MDHPATLRYYPSTNYYIAFLYNTKMTLKKSYCNLEVFMMYKHYIQSVVSECTVGHRVDKCSTRTREYSSV